MGRWRTALAVLAVWASAAGLAAADDKYALREALAVGDQYRTELDMRLTGTVQVRSGDKTISMDLSARAGHQFSERVLAADRDGLPTRVARSYEKAQADIAVHGVKSQRTLRPERQLLVAQQLRGDTVTYCPAGPLTREEWELTGEHLDVLAVYGLLPDKDVAVGEKWDVPVTVAQRMVDVDGVVKHDLRCQLRAVNGYEAVVAVGGSLEGITRGSELTAAVEATLTFDLRAKRLTGVTWTQKDRRSQGPVLPGSTTETTVTMRRVLGTRTETLADAVVAGLPAEPTPDQLLLAYRDPKGRFEFLHGRDWHVVAQNDTYAVLRLLDRGELIGQVNVTPWQKERPGQHLSPDELKKFVGQAPGFMTDQILQAGDVPAEAGHWVHRISVVGRANDVPVVQNYYAVAGPQGDQVILTFTTEVALVERLNNADLSIVGTVSFPKGPTK